MRTVVVVGAGGEMGTEICQCLREDGYRVLTTHRNPPSELQTDEQGRKFAYALDVTEAKQIERAVTLINLGARLQVLDVRDSFWIAIRSCLCCRLHARGANRPVA